MALPKKMKLYPERDLKLGIKSSFPEVKASLALIYLLWKSNDRVARLDYSKQIGNSIQSADDCANQLLQMTSPILAAQDLSDIDIISSINDNQIYKSQMEALQVAFELIWKVAKVSFTEKRGASAERTNNIRYNKTLSLSTNIDLLDLLVEQDRNTYLTQLVNWVVGQNSEVCTKAHNSLEKMLTVFSESAVYRTRLSSSEEIKFQNWGIYEPLSNGDEKVDISDFKEATGPLRILKPALESGMNAFLQVTPRSNLVSIKPGIAPSEFKAYIDRVDTYHELVSTKINVSSIGGLSYIGSANRSTTEDADGTYFPRNRIVFGAPGTGKSFLLENDRLTAKRDNDERFFSEESFERVTFHPSFSYAQFVGCYKPAPKVDENASPPEYISYEYVPGPLMRALVKSWNKKDVNYLLIIEEINRANVAGTFGDIFQLLDRDANGESEYTISVSEDMHKYLNEHAPGLVSPEKQLKLPGNLYIWATMNSADQGVSPVDTAFKRRWSFEFLPIDYREEELDGRMVTLKYGVSIEWNQLRKSINSQLISGSMGITEDKLIGPFFLSNDELDEELFDNAFKSKLLMYIYEDVLKRRSGGFFVAGINSFSELVCAYDDGERIFNFEIPQESTIEDLNESD